MILPFNFKKNYRLGHKKTKLDPCSLGTPLRNTSNLIFAQAMHSGFKNGSKPRYQHRSAQCSQNGSAKLKIKWSNLFFANLVKSMKKPNPNENKIWTQNLKGPQLTQMFQRLDSGKIMQAHSSPKLEEQSWRFNMFSANLVKRMQTWATEAQNLKGP